MNTYIALLIYCLSLYSLSANASYSARATVYELGDAAKKTLFEYDRTADATHSHAQYKTPDGKLFSDEKVTQEAHRFQTYQLDLPLLGESAEVSVKEGKVHIRYTTPKGVKTEVEDWAPNYVISPTIADYVRAHWDEIQKGESIRVRMVVPDRVESIGFKLYKDGTETWNAKQVDRILFAPTSVFVSMVVKPVVLLFDPQNRQTVQVSGKSLLKKKTENGWEDFLALTVFKTGSSKSPNK